MRECGLSRPLAGCEARHMQGGPPMARPSDRAHRARVRRKRLALGTAMAAMSTVLVACSSSSATPVLTWYINPDTGGQDAIAKNCSTNDYTIQTQVLPSDASQQRIQLARRLAA